MRLIFTLLFFILSGSFFTQNKSFINALKLRLLQNNNSERYTVLVRGEIPKLIAFEKQFNYRVNYYSGDIASIDCNLQDLSSLIDHKFISSAEFIEPHKQVMNDTMLKRNRIKPVKLGAAPLAQAYDGSGIVIGLIDTGIDFMHGDFKDANGNSEDKIYLGPGSRFQVQRYRHRLIMALNGQMRRSTRIYAHIPILLFMDTELT